LLVGAGRGDLGLGDLVLGDLGLGDLDWVGRVVAQTAG
jgi:hypothetical protein